MTRFVNHDLVLSRMTQKKATKIFLQLETRLFLIMMMVTRAYKSGVGLYNVECICAKVHLHDLGKRGGEKMHMIL